MRAVQVILGFMVVMGVFLALSHNDVFADGDKPVLENLMRSQLEGVKDREVIVSRVTMPPNTTLPKHTHPGEEFGYVLEGTIIFWQEGKEEIVFTKGDVAKVPLNQIHSVRTTDDGATLLVFRVHETGKPERTLVE